MSVRTALKFQKTQVIFSVPAFCLWIWMGVLICHSSVMSASLVTMENYLIGAVNSK